MGPLLPILALASLAGGGYYLYNRKSEPKQITMKRPKGHPKPTSAKNTAPDGFDTKVDAAKRAAEKGLDLEELRSTGKKAGQLVSDVVNVFRRKDATTQEIQSGPSSLDVPRGGALIDSLNSLSSKNIE